MLKTMKLPHAPAVQAASTSTPLAQLKIPPSMPFLMQDDYPNVRFWNKENWVKYEEKRNRGGNMAKNSKMEFLCDEDGNPLSDARHKQITEAGKPETRNQLSEKCWNHQHRYLQLGKGIR